ncbi:diguanylate cyclase (GGDEF)-like protein [Tibeticola sediminis]|uniref:diguanylate cyclase n=1 Tax=Tibeticola sediminis TaxID=1917811 RepID=A0A3N4UJD5_9BURK|nr:GGDEF domain-containing protein [Tibeticola sediminis]RPE70563.1 diguanylate cyclase (GGDEF)-like protein [Tibeticola sediminis]
MSALQPKKSLPSTKIADTLGVTEAASSPTLSGAARRDLEAAAAPEWAAGAGAAIRATRAELVAWLQALLRQGVYRLRPGPVAVMPIGRIHQQLSVALAAAVETPALQAARERLSDDLARADARSAALASLDPSDPEAPALYDELIALGLDALQQLSEIEIELAAQHAGLDALTGLPGRRALYQRLAAEHARSQRSVHRCAVVLIDLDRFKPVNDQYGHLVGDDFLRAFAAALRAELRPYDAAFRFGGDEFVLVLPDVTNDQAEAVVERIRQRLQRQPLLEVDGTPLWAEFSAGVAALDGARTPAEALGRADAQLYAAKARRAHRVAQIPTATVPEGAPLARPKRRAGS